LTILLNNRLGVLATIKRSGVPQLSLVTYKYSPDPAIVRIMIGESRAKYVNLLRDARASIQVTEPNGSSYAVVEGAVELSPVVRNEEDAVVDNLIALYRDIAGEHPDWA